MGLWDFDLHGFEPESKNPLGEFLKHLVETRAREDAAAREKAKGAVKPAARAITEMEISGAASDWAASLLSLLWQFEDSGERFAEVLSQPSSDAQAPPREDPATLRTVLDELCQQQKLIIHVRDSSSWTSAQRRWFIREAERAPERLLLVISCTPEAETREVAPSDLHEPLRIELRSLSAENLRDALSRRFASNTFPGDLASSLVTASAGRPGAIANTVADLVDLGAIETDQDGDWRLLPEGSKDHRLVAALSSGLFEDLDRRLAKEDARTQKMLREFLILAALGGRYVPLPPIFDFLGLAPEDHEAVTDFVDDVLEEELGWLVDAGFRHPSFPGINVYAFTNPLLPRIVLDQISELDREVYAVKLLRFLEEIIRPRHRGMARWLFAIAEHLGSKETAVYGHQLSWWCGPVDSESLCKEIRSELEGGELDSAMVWRVIEEASGWPPFRRLAMLDAYIAAVVKQDDAGESSLSLDDLAKIHTLRGGLLIQQGRSEEALEEAQRVLALAEDKSARQAVGFNLSGLARAQLGRAQLASRDFEQSLELWLALFGSEHPATLTAQSNLASAYSHQGEYERARELEDALLEVTRRALGPEHPATLTAQSNLEETERKLAAKAPAEV